MGNGILLSIKLILPLNIIQAVSGECKHVNAYKGVNIYL